MKSQLQASGKQGNSSRLNFQGSQARRDCCKIVEWLSRLLELQECPVTGVHGHVCATKHRRIVNGTGGLRAANGVGPVKPKAWCGGG